MTNTMGPPPSQNPNSSANQEIKPVDELSSPSSSSSSSIVAETAAATSMGSATAMRPPPPRNSSEPVSSQSTMDTAEDQPPRDSTNVGAAEPVEMDTENSSPHVNAKPQAPKSSQGIAVPYKIPPWSGAPCHEFYLEVLKEGSIIDKLDVCEKGAYMFGRLDLCDFVLEHPTISRFHAVIQFKRSGDAYLYDLGSTHGTFLNKNQVN